MYTDRFQTRPLLPPAPPQSPKNSPPCSPPPTGGEHPDFSGDLKIPVKTQEFWPKIVTPYFPPTSGRESRRKLLPLPFSNLGGFYETPPSLSPHRGGSVHPHSYITKTWPNSKFIAKTEPTSGKTQK